VVSVAAIVTLWVKITKIQNQEDQRLSKGLQLLQSKLAVLEDLSDRTEVQVNQLIAILEGKIKDIQSKLIDADKVIGKIEKNIAKSLEVANIFQDKIPHQEILERQYTKKYVKAAQLAHAGHTIDEIAQVVELTQGEIELIVKLNKDRLQFDISELPVWAKEEMADSGDQDMELNVPTIFESRTENNPLRSLETAFEVPKVDNQNLKKLGDQFRSAMAAQPAVKASVMAAIQAEVGKVQTNAVEAKPVPTQAPAQTVKPAATTTSQKTSSNPFSKRASEINNEIINTFSQFFDSPAETTAEAKANSNEQVIVQGGKTMTVKPFQFKRIDDDAQM
jgi:mannose/fructose/N-acetylgalactosamine-specific phosphotransferase system component IIB